MPLSKSYRAQSRLKFIPPRYNPWIRQASYALLPLLLRVRLRPWLPAGIWPVTCQNPEVLVDCFHQFQAGKIRLILAFRHSQVDDPLCMSYLFSRLLPEAAKAQGHPFSQSIHSHFMYDRGMPLWAGRWLGWFFSRMGGVPVHRGRKLDLMALKAVRELLAHGSFPFTIAPEGATNGHGEIISPLEPGTAQLAFWTVEDLQKSGRSESVLLLPVGLRYFYPHPGWAALNHLMAQLEADSGLDPQPFASPAATPPEDYFQRLRRLGLHLLARMEQFYHQFYPKLATEHHLVADPMGAIAQSTETFNTHLQQVLETALEAGEQFFNLPSTGDLPTRCRQLEEAGWSYIYREEKREKRQETPSLLDQGLANWMAELAQVQMRHMRLVESFVSVNGHYVQDHPSFERLAETTLILFDLVERAKGTSTPRRPQLGQRHAVITVGQPLDVSQRWPAYAQSRRSAKIAVETLMTDLQQAMEDLIPLAETLPH
jgi:hypothetical protein